MSDRLFAGCNYLLMLGLTVSILYPFWQTIVLSFTGSDEATTLGFHLWSQEWSLEAYKFLFTYDDIIGPYINTVIRTVAGTAIGVAFTIIAAYPLAKRELPYRNMITIYFLIPMFFGGGLIPTYLLIKSIGLQNNFLVLLIPPAVSIFNVVIMRNYFMTIDKTYEESAFMDGASYTTLLIRILLPISLPVLVTIALWDAVAHWNAWFDAMIYITDRNKLVIQVVLREMLTAVNERANDVMEYSGQTHYQLSLTNVRAAVVLLSIGPIVLVYPYIQKYFVKGITLGSLKG